MVEELRSPFGQTAAGDLLAMFSGDRALRRDASRQARSRVRKAGLAAFLLLALVGLSDGREARAVASRGQVLDARAEFGAKGDGVSDDTAALQAALDAAEGTSPDCEGTVHLLAGAYNISGPLVARSFSNIDGDGMDATVVRVDPGSGDAVDPMIALRGVEHVAVQEMHLDGNNSNLS